MVFDYRADAGDREATSRKDARGPQAYPRYQRMKMARDRALERAAMAEQRVKLLEAEIADLRERLS